MRKRIYGHLATAPPPLPGYNREPAQLSGCFTGAVGNLLCLISQFSEKSVSSPQLPALLWDKSAFTTALSDSTYLITIVLKVLTIFIFLMFLIILLLMIWKAMNNKDRRNLEAALLAERSTSLGGDSVEVRTKQPKNQSHLEA